MTESSRATVHPNLNVDEAAEALRVSPRTVRKLIATRALRCLHIGRRVLVSSEALIAFVRTLEEAEPK